MNAAKRPVIIIGNGVYRIGIGGLHSQEQSQSYWTIPGVQTLRDIDVKSYYPSLIAHDGITPPQLPDFASRVGTLMARRLAAKKASGDRGQKRGHGSFQESGGRTDQRGASIWLRNSRATSSIR